MTFQDVLKICKSKDWSKLSDVMRSDFADMSIKILVSAIFDTYHSDIIMKQQYGLSTWNERLTNHFIEETGRTYVAAPMSNVDLLDFHKALHIAKDTIKDKFLAKKIKDYVNGNRAMLWGILEDPALPIELNDMLTSDFAETNHYQPRRFNLFYQSKQGFKKLDSTEEQKTSGSKNCCCVLQ